jgi:N-acetylglucosaminyldiphosphoundecaprenol N-acetyl-beta-D-mannosaminyltransferase
MLKIANKFSDFLLKPNLSIVLNTEGLYFLLFDREFRKVVEGADIVFCDGIGLKIALELSGVKRVARLHGPDLFHEILHGDHKRRQLILGGSELAHQKLLKKYQNLENNLNIKLFSGFIEEDNLSEVMSIINDFKPDIIHVCLGIRKQELIGSRLRKLRHNCAIVGVGASVDFESGNVVRSPIIFQRMGLEWLPRLVREPRMIPRIARSLIGLLVYAILGVLKINNNNFTLTKILKK